MVFKIHINYLVMNVIITSVIVALRYVPRCGFAEFKSPPTLKSLDQY